MKAKKIKVKRNQIWRKKDSGRLAVVAATCGDRKVKISLDGSKRTHETRVKDLCMFWELV